uniref:Plant natriuretic peptide-like 5 n=1 Tax=Venturia pyrina TaxID=415593 RepID=A0A513ZS94_9PEZI|nr:plant natriuretic peptide-like 5 [Venturia pyrina]
MKAPALIALSWFAHLGLCGEIASASTYKPPYFPNKCFGGDQAAFPPGGYFAKVGSYIWNNGAACGQCYRVRCVAAFGAGQHCIGDRVAGRGKSIIVKVIEGRLGPRAPDFTLSQTAGAEIYTGGGPSGGGSFRVEWEQIGQC